MSDKIDKLVDAFDRLAGNVGDVVCYMQKTEKMITQTEKTIRRTGRMMIIQTVLAIAVLLMFGAMAWVVGSAWTEVATAQASLAEIEKSNQATYDYLIGKFPEDTAELAIVKAEPAAAKAVIKEIEPLPDPGGKRAAKGIERRDKVIESVKAAMPKQQKVEQWQVEYQLTPPMKKAAEKEEEAPASEE